MTPENFVYWLQGFLEIGDPKELDEGQIKVIKDHLDLVLGKVTPEKGASADVRKRFQDLLDEAAKKNKRDKSKYPPALRTVHPPGRIC